MQPSSKIFRCMPKVAAILLVAIVLAGCRQEVSQAAGPPPVTVAQPVKRTITEWDEFTGRFEAIEEVQVRARVGSSSPASSSRTATWFAPVTCST
jgi:multidrug efflux pump subunit AcrA (membrane-fusion protein)